MRRRRRKKDRKGQITHFPRNTKQRIALSHSHSALTGVTFLIEMLYLVSLFLGKLYAPNLKKNHYFSNVMDILFKLFRQK